MQLLVLCLGTALPANAQLLGSVSIGSDVRLRGLSINGSRPALTASFGYDHPSGVYIGAAATAGATRRFGTQFLNSSVNLGYAARLSPDWYWELGASDTRVNSRVRQQFSGGYTEVYAGIGSEQINARLFYSPAFFRRGVQATYLDLNANLRPLQRVRAFGHFGLLVPLGDAGAAILPRSRYDTRLGAAVERGRSEFHLAWVRTGAGEAYLAPREQSADALIIGASWFF